MRVRGGGANYNYNEFDSNWLELDYVLLKCLEMIFVVIWRYINKTELN